MAWQFSVEMMADQRLKYSCWDKDKVNEAANSTICNGSISVFCYNNNETSNMWNFTPPLIYTAQWFPWSVGLRTKSGCVLLFLPAVRMRQHISVLTTQQISWDIFSKYLKKENPVTMVGPAVSCFSLANQQTRQNYSLRTQTLNLGLVIAGWCKAKIEKRNCEEHCGEFLMTVKKADKLSEKQQIVSLALKI